MKSEFLAITNDVSTVVFYILSQQTVNSLRAKTGPFTPYFKMPDT